MQVKHSTFWALNFNINHPPLALNIQPNFRIYPVWMVDIIIIFYYWQWTKPNVESDQINLLMQLKFPYFDAISEYNYMEFCSFSFVSWAL